MGYEVILTRREMIRRGALVAGGVVAGLGPLGLRVPAALADTGQTWADYASQFNGYPYVFGGNTPDGWDCSGFTQYVAAHFGVSIDHGTVAQYGEGVPISYGDIQAGDYVYFQGTSDENEAITHVGIVTDPSQGLMINALNSSAGTVFSYYTSGYFQSHWYGQARFWGGSSPAPSPSPSPSPAPSGTTATTTADLNLRSGPGMSYAVIAVIPEGATVTITDATQNGWDPVAYQGDNGWASAFYLTTGDAPSPPPAPTPSPTPSGTTLVATANVNVRTGPNTTYASLGVIASGTRVTWDGAQQGGGGYTWDHVATPLGTGWVANAFLSS